MYRVCYLAGEMVEMLKCQLHDEHEKKGLHSDIVPITDQDVLCVKIAGLCHDLGKINELGCAYFTSMKLSIAFVPPKVMVLSPTFLMVDSFLQSKVQTRMSGK